MQGFPDWAFERACFGKEIPRELRKKKNARTMTKKEWKQYYKITKKQVTSNSQLYKQAGNSVTVNVIEWIAKKFKKDEAKNDTCN